MNNFNMTNDAATVDRLSQQRDDIYDWVVERFRYFMEHDEIDNAMALADEFYEWMDPDGMENEVTSFYNEEELLRLYMSLPEEE
jgi:glycogen debranching enzyme